jgi:hypothetical protein
LQGSFGRYTKRRREDLVNENKNFGSIRNSQVTHQTAERTPATQIKSRSPKDGKKQASAAKGKEE